ncbi:MAG: tRNA pseudouridine(55) synthase TruB [Faecousia sp.]
MAAGIIIIDKPQNWTSQDVAARLRRVFGTKRIGHGGTLDPMATGVLPVFVGRATRAVEFFENAQKEYIATLRLGLLTDTEDTTGTVLETRPVNVTRADVEAMLPRFLGKQTQIPPMYSAVKINGKKLYELARQGKTVERQPRPIEIFELELLDLRQGELDLRVACSKGTYIRTLCKDMGLALGCGGCMAALRRSRAGAYTLDQAVPLDTLLSMAERGEDVEKLLLPIDSVFLDHPPVRLTPRQAKACRNGAKFSIPLSDGVYRLYEWVEFLALGKCENGIMSTIKSFFEVN